MVEGTNSKCLFYNWGGEGTKERPAYPREYGARCELYNEFFSEDDGRLQPNCSECIHDMGGLTDLLQFI